MMSVLKTFGFVSVLAMTSAGVASQARAADTLSLFAQCAGRFSAEMEFAWLMGNQDSETPKRLRSHFVDMIDAVLMPDDGPNVLARRIEAKVAHTALLSRAQFSQNPTEMRVAAQTAERDVAFCRAMLTG
ncbi:MAG: hypothetical protein ABJD13_06065 [Paracoccaceae bacterium]